MPIKLAGTECLRFWGPFLKLSISKKTKPKHRRDPVSEDASEENTPENATKEPKDKQENAAAPGDTKWQATGKLGRRFLDEIKECWQNLESLTVGTAWSITRKLSIG